MLSHVLTYPHTRGPWWPHAFVADVIDPSPLGLGKADAADPSSSGLGEGDTPDPLPLGSGEVAVSFSSASHLAAGAPLLLVGHSAVIWRPTWPKPRTLRELIRGQLPKERSLGDP
jgi:hypothetical protein